MTRPVAGSGGREAGGRMKPYYSDEWVTLYHSRWEDVPPDLLRADVLVTDPPYGIGWQVEDGSFRSRSRIRRGDTYEAIVGDEQPFDPAPLLALALPSVLFGANHYADRLPSSTAWIVWDKRPSGFSNDQADCELAWTNLDGPARIVRKAWSGGGTLRKENGAHPVVGVTAFHPSQKPVEVMLAVVQRCPNGTVLDPYAGSGSTLVAAKSLGRKSIGVECVERYCETAANRCSQEVLGLSA